LHPAEVSLLPVQLLAQGILDCLFVQGTVPSQAFRRPNKKHKNDGVRLGMWDGCGGNYVLPNFVMAC